MPGPQVEDDGDSTMLDEEVASNASSLSETSLPADSKAAPKTPPQNILPPSSELSPPDSRGPRHSQLAPESSVLSDSSTSKMPPSAALNANGKRALHPKSAASNTASSTNGKAAVKEEKGVHVCETGYSWRKDEDAPGYPWMSQKGKEEYNRHIGSVVDRDRMIKNRYGDVLLK